MTISHALAVRSDHSIGESIMQIDFIVDKAKELGFSTVALTDTMTVSGVVPFTNRCLKQGIKPVTGCTLRVYQDPLYRKPKKSSGEVEKDNPFYQLKVYVKSDNGFKSLMKLLSKGNSAEYFYYHSRVGIDDVMDLEDVVVTTGDLFNLFHSRDHLEILERLSSKFETFVEISPINTPLFDTLNEKAINAARKTGCRLLATYPFFYGSPEDAGALDVLRAIAINAKMSDVWLPRPYTRDWSFASPETLAVRMLELSKRLGMTREEVKQSLRSPGELVDACQYRFEKQEPSLPKMAEDEFAKLIEECKNGWRERFSLPVLGHKPDSRELLVYKERLAYELGVLQKLGFANY
ncbi:PHP domain-containing protein, partial [Oxalobacter sp. OttesenSCG-928-P03]|nr:PHP domain-containing protein [Oxalobacter sp. OttesenSCG-928-P03]